MKETKDAKDIKEVKPFITTSSLQEYRKNIRTVYQGLLLVPIHRDTRMYLKKQKRGKLKSKKERKKVGPEYSGEEAVGSTLHHRMFIARGQNLKRVCQGLLLVPIHGDILIYWKTEKEGVFNWL